MNSIRKIYSLSQPLRIGIIGTGYVAQKRAETFLQDERSQLCCVTGHTPDKVATFGQTYGISTCESWETLISHQEIDLVVICTINQDHAVIARTALKTGKHVILEYPLALNFAEGSELLSLAIQQEKLLHIEHIELLGGMHQKTRQYLPQLGQVFYGRYTTITSQKPAPRRWTYHREMFGFPMIAALPHIHRFTDLFGTVSSVSSNVRYWDAPEEGYFTACLCDVQLEFNDQLKVDSIYSKGEVFWKSERTFELYGSSGTLKFVGNLGTLITEEGTKTIELSSRRGLFAQDTEQILDHLFGKIPLYVSPQSSLYALQVADIAYQSSQLGSKLNVE
ncbi:MAG: Gfo/Idh/MocA family protein [cyanobacterium endosymbiont of Rhopalodia musculus]|uniref:Gfo/Idh/MocA family protein n=1 Tax=cyanobacterium endosymbiont of Epithemia clementina EcSB TaxID=3034674 RepID=UPI002481812F|nr:Gfo/Idh/MocA family oxidoreductase [cyanobacterium endosymbiont of Epithemia clementina EcSB]WGT68325.1 Gfo/Idh/MocA family oxidoreductase [cyanobacterium endosymbiont of Epithemia clementina EcSB]